MSTAQSLAVESAGATLLKALLGEIRQLPKPWEQTPEREQEVVIDRLRRGVESAVRSLVSTMAACEFQRVPATIESVTFKDGVKAALLLSREQEGTHQLARATGGQVMVVLASPAEFLEGLERVRAEADQRELFEQEYAAVSDEGWQALVDSLEEGAPEDQPEIRSMGAQCQEILARVHVHVAIEVCEAWSEQECTVAAYWALQYAKDPATAPARPHWLPLPQPPAEQASSESADAAADAETDGESDGKDGADEGEHPEAGRKRRRRGGNSEAHPH